MFYCAAPANLKHVKVMSIIVALDLAAEQAAFPVMVLAVSPAPSGWISELNGGGGLLA